MENQKATKQDGKSKDESKPAGADVPAPSANSPSGDIPSQVTISSIEDIILRCTTTDEKEMDVSLSVMRISHLIADMFKDLSEQNEPVVHIPMQVDSGTFAKVVEWCTSHVGQPDPVMKEEPMTRNIIPFDLTPEDEAFFYKNIDIEGLVALMEASNYLDIKTLYHYSCQAFAERVLKDKSPSQIRDILRLEDDLTEKEKDDYRQQNLWYNH